VSLPAAAKTSLGRQRTPCLVLAVRHRAVGAAMGSSLSSCLWAVPGVTASSSPTTLGAPSVRLRGAEVHDSVSFSGDGGCLGAHDPVGRAGGQPGSWAEEPPAGALATVQERLRARRWAATQKVGSSTPQRPGPHPACLHRSDPDDHHRLAPRCGVGRPPVADRHAHRRHAHRDEEHEPSSEAHTSPVWLTRGRPPRMRRRPTARRSPPGPPRL